MASVDIYGIDFAWSVGPPGCLGTCHLNQFDRQSFDASTERFLNLGQILLEPARGPVARIVIRNIRVDGEHMGKVSSEDGCAFTCERADLDENANCDTISN